MNSRIKIFTYAIATALFAVPANAETVWADGVSKKTGWIDINKNWQTDKFHCWAASAANIIAWWQEKVGEERIPAGTPKGADAIFTAISDTFVDCGRGADIAWKWYFGGCDLVEFNYEHDFRNPENARTSGRFWQNNILKKYGWAKPRQGVPAYIEAGFAYDTSPDARNAERLAETIVRLFKEGKGITLDLGPGGAFPQGHAITLWGIDYRGNRIKSLYITDSDDRCTGLKKYDVAYVTTQETQGDGKDGKAVTTWEKTTIFLQNYCGSDRYHILNWAALGLPRPVPAKSGNR